MAVEYDEEKSQKTFRERAIGFDCVSRIFESDYIEKKDRRRDYGEGRLVASRSGRIRRRVRLARWAPANYLRPAR